MGSRGSARPGNDRSPGNPHGLGQTKKKKSSIKKPGEEAGETKAQKDTHYSSAGQNKEIIRNVVNISNRTLKDEEISLLARALNFCPDKHFEHFGTLLDVNKFSRSLTLKRHYFESPIDTEEVPLGDFEAGESSPPSPKMFAEVCALHDLIDLAEESNPSPTNPVGAQNNV